MQNVPKIVRDRLKMTTPAVSHPGADLLTAFTERSLSDRERSTVLDHLARCGDCRDIVALALPETEAAQTVVAPVRGAWLAWPVVRWGFITAGVIAIASFGILQYRRQSHIEMVAKEQSNTTFFVGAQAPAPAPVIPSEEKAKSAKGSSPALAASAPSSLKSPSPELAGSRGGPVGGKNVAALQQMGRAKQNAELDSNWAPSSPKAVPNASGEVVEAQSAPAVEVTAQAVNQDTALRNQPSSQLFDDDGKRVDKIKPAMNSANAAIVAKVIPRWSISSSGALQRSFDQGATWQNVNVTANLAPSAAMTSYGYVARARESQAKELASADKDIRKKVAAAPAVAPVFRAVAASGADIWAGGSGAALFHSLDAGNHWAQITPAAGGVALTGDVLALEFVDAAHGKVTTSTSETWLTSDDGLTWQKQ